MFAQSLILEIFFLCWIQYLTGEKVWTVLQFLPKWREKEFSASLVYVAGSIISIKATTDSVNFFRILKKFYPKYYSSSSVVCTLN